VRTRSAAVLSSVVGAAILFAGCGGSGGGKPSIVLYNGQHLELTRSLVSAFERTTGITVHLRTNDSVVLADQIQQEGTSSPADVYLAENSPELTYLEEQGLLAPLPAALLDQVPARDRSPHGRWVGMALRVGSLDCDPAKLGPSGAPSSILDLARPEWRGKVAVAPLDSDFPPIVGAVIARKGAKAAASWLAGLKRNAQIYQDEEALVAAVERGDVACGIVNHYYWYRLQLETGSKLRSKLFSFGSGDPGSVVNVAGAAVLGSSRHRRDAERFVEFLVSPAGQRLIAHGDDFEYPVRPGIPPNPALPPLERIPHSSFPVVALGDDREAARLVVAAGFGS
jgi:iron(III) transport system substrate-binding protein